MADKTCADCKKKSRAERENALPGVTCSSGLARSAQDPCYRYGL